MTQTLPAPPNGAPLESPFGTPQAPSTIDKLMAAANAQAQQRKRMVFEVPNHPDIMPLEDREVIIPGRGRCAILSITMNVLGAGEERDVYKRSAALGSDQVVGILEATEALAFVELAPIRPVEVKDDDGKPVTVETPIVSEKFEFSVTTRDGSAEGLYAGMSPAMRKLVVAGYVSSTSPTQTAAALFTASRRTVTR